MGLRAHDKSVRSDVMHLTSSSQIGALEEALGNELERGEGRERVRERGRKEGGEEKS